MRYKLLDDAYAVAKIACIKMCQSFNEQYGTNYKCLMPTNTFGPNDNYDYLSSHFFPALIRKIHDIKKNNTDNLLLWGNGKSKREVIHVDDIADSCIYFMNKKTKDFLINIGSGKDCTIEHYAKLILKIIIGDKKINISYDKSKPNGTLRKVMDVSLAKKYGWKSKMNLENSILNCYQSYLKELKL